MGQNFYIEAQMSFQEGHGCFSAMGFAVGNNGGNHHRFLLIGGTDLDCEEGIAFFNNENQLFATPYNSVMEKEKTHVVSLESLNGVYTLYLNGVATESQSLQNYGADIGLFAWRFGNGFLPSDSTFFFDNVMLREFR